MTEGNEDDYLAALILSGAIEVAGLDSESGELLYSFTEKAKDLVPDLFKAHMDSVNQEVMSLWQKGFLDVDLFSNNPIITITEKALDESELAKLSAEDRWSIEEIKRLMKKRRK